ncbi:MAG: hypothetical protein ACLP8X_41115 [Streptosporangiaceae bacterium]
MIGGYAALALGIVSFIGAARDWPFPFATGASPHSPTRGQEHTIHTWHVPTFRRLLVCGIALDTPLLSGETRGIEPSDLSLAYRHQMLRDPHVVSLVLENRSRSDIPSSDFDQGKPLLFDVGVPIMALLSIEGLQADLLERPHINGSHIEVGPTLILRRQMIRFNMLTDGRPSLTWRSLLINVEVRGQKSGERRPLLIQNLALIVFFACFAIAVSAIISDNGIAKAAEIMLLVVSAALLLIARAGARRR